MKPTNQRISDGWYHIDQQRKQERARLRSDIARPQPVRGGCLGALLLAIVRLLVLIFVLAVACGLVVVIAAYAL